MNTLRSTSPVPPRLCAPTLGAPSLAVYAQNAVYDLFCRADAQAALRPLVAPRDADEQWWGQGVRAVIYDAATHPQLADCADMAALDMWALSGAFRRADDAFAMSAGSDARARRVRHACQMAGAYAAVGPAWWVAPQPADVAAMVLRAGALARGPALGPRRFAQAWLAALVVHAPNAAARLGALSALEEADAFGDALAELPDAAAKLAQLHAWFAATLGRGVAVSAPHRNNLLRLADALTDRRAQRPCRLGDTVHPARARYDALREAVAIALGTLGVAGAEAWLAYHEDMPLQGLRAGWARLGGFAAHARAVQWQTLPGRPDLTTTPGYATWLLDIDMPDIVAQLEAAWQVAGLPGRHTARRAEVLRQVLRLRQRGLTLAFVDRIAQMPDRLLQAEAALATAEAGLHVDAHRLALAACNGDRAAGSPARAEMLEIVDALQKAVVASPELAEPVGTFFVATLMQERHWRVRTRLLDALGSLDTPVVNRYLMLLSRSSDGHARIAARRLLLRDPRAVDCEPLARQLLSASEARVRTHTTPLVMWLLRQGDTERLKALLLRLLADDDAQQTLALRAVARGFGQPDLGDAARAFAPELTCRVFACLDLPPLASLPCNRRVAAAARALQVLHAYHDAAGKQRIVEQLADVAQGSGVYPADALRDVNAALAALTGTEAPGAAPAESVAHPLLEDAGAVETALRMLENGAC